MDDFVTTADTVAEAGVISGLIFSRSMPPAALCLSPGDFSTPAYRMAFEALKQAHSEGKRPEFRVVERAIGTNEARAVEKTALENRLSPNHLSEYISAIIESSVRRKVIERCRKVASMAMNRNVNQCEILSAMNANNLGIVSTREPRNLKELVAEVKAEIQKPFTGSENDILHCGMPTIDNNIGGFSRGNVTTICAVPGCGKSALVINMALSAAKKEGHSSLIASIEDVATVQAMRMIASSFGISLSSIRRRELSTSDIERTFTDEIDLPIYIEDAPYQTPESIRAMAISHKVRHGKLDFLIIDHLIEMTDESDPVRSTAKNVKALRDIAKETNCHVLLLTQPRKNVDRTKKLCVSDMVESGRVEQVSRGIWLLYRSDTEPDIIAVDVAKNTNGNCQPFRLNFNGSIMQVW